MQRIRTLQSKYEEKCNLYLNFVTIAILFFTPITARFPDNHTISFLFFLIYIGVLLRGNYIKYFQMALAHPLTKPFLYFFLIHIIWLIGSESPKEAVGEWLKYEYYSLYPLLFFSFIDKRLFAYFLGAFLSGAFLNEILSYMMQFHIIPMQYSIHLSIPSIDYEKIKFLYRSFRGDPTPFVEHSATSFMLAVTSAILLINLFLQKKINWIYLFFFITISINIFFIQARTGYLLYFLLTAYVVYYFFTHHTKLSLSIPKELLYIIPVLSLIIAIFMYNQDGIFKKRLEVTQERFAKALQGDLHATPRLLLVKQAAVAIKDNFPLGVGSGDALKTLQAYPQNKNTEISSGFIRDVHNQYLHILLEYGVIGLLVYLYLLYKIFTYNTTMSQQKYLIKQVVAISMIYISFLATFWAYVPTIIVMLLIITTAQNTTLKQLPAKGKKTTASIVGFIFLSYIIGTVQ